MWISCMVPVSGMVRVAEWNRTTYLRLIRAVL